jgi:hypothetical protein
MVEPIPGNETQTYDAASEVYESRGESVDTSLFTGLAFNPTAAFIGGTDGDGNPNVTDVSAPADVVGATDTAQDLPTVDDENEIAETGQQAGEVAGSAVEGATDVTIDVATDSALAPIRKLAALLLLGIAGLFGLQALLQGIGEGAVQ